MRELDERNKDEGERKEIETEKELDERDRDSTAQ